jgi:hypothetical protein
MDAKLKPLLTLFAKMDAAYTEEADFLEEGEVVSGLQTARGDTILLGGGWSAEIRPHHGESGPITVVRVRRSEDALFGTFAAYEGKWPTILVAMHQMWIWWQRQHPGVFERETGLEPRRGESPPE